MATAVLFLDQGSKYLADHFLSSDRALTWGPISLQRVYDHANQLFPAHQPWFVLPLCVVFLGALFAVCRRAPTTWTRAGLVLMLGGASGNQLDHLFFHRLVDFLYIDNRYVCNFADGALVIGAVLFATGLLLVARSRKTADCTA